MSDNSLNQQTSHSRKFLEMASDDAYHERMYRPNGYGKNTGDCGDTVEIFLNVKNGIIQDVTFDIEGCVNTFACANVIAHSVYKKPLDAAWEITPDFVIETLKTLPPENHHCAELAAGALYLAVTDFRKRGF